jgi:hypothetical protein
MCGTACMGSVPCLAGKCGCPQGQTLCGDSCVDLNADPAHCGSCGKACASGSFCTNKMCLRSPCDGLCSPPETVSLSVDGFRVDPLGTAGRCLEISGYAPTATNSRIVCWNFDATRSLKVNGVTVPCLTDAGFALTSERAGGYCVQIGPGGATDAGVLLPIK